MDTFNIFSYPDTPRTHRPEARRPLPKATFRYVPGCYYYYSLYGLRRGSYGQSPSHAGRWCHPEVIFAGQGWKGNSHDLCLGTIPAFSWWGWKTFETLSQHRRQSDLNLCFSPVSSQSQESKQLDHGWEGGKLTAHTNNFIFYCYYYY